MQWEYTIFVWEGQIDRNKESDFTLKLNQLGDKGWELINIIPQTTVAAGNGGTQRNVLVFKKPR